MNIKLNAIDHFCVAALGAGFALEQAGLADLPWTYYVGLICIMILWMIAVATFHASKGRSP
jgi:hypothetical protein